MQALYEDKVLGSVPEAVFKNLKVTYEAERTEKLALVYEMKQRLAGTAQDERGIEQYLQNIKKYVAIEQLDREMLLELIRYIEIGERQVVDGHTTYKVRANWTRKLVGIDKFCWCHNCRIFHAGFQKILVAGK